MDAPHAPRTQPPAQPRGRPWQPRCQLCLLAVSLLPRRPSPREPVPAKKSHKTRSLLLHTPPEDTTACKMDVFWLEQRLALTSYIFYTYFVLLAHHACRMKTYSPLRTASGCKALDHPAATVAARTTLLVVALQEEGRGSLARGACPLCVVVGCRGAPLFSHCVVVQASGLLTKSSLAPNGKLRDGRHSGRWRQRVVERAGPLTMPGE